MAFSVLTDNPLMPSGCISSRPSRLGGGVGTAGGAEGDAEVARVRVDCRVGADGGRGTLRLFADDGRGGGRCASAPALGNGLWEELPFGLYGGWRWYCG